MLIQEALALYAQQLAADGRSTHTVRQAERHVRLFALWIGDRTIEETRHEDVARFLASDTVTRTATGTARKPTSANALRSSLRCFFGYVHASAIAPVNAARLVRRALCGPSRPKALSDADQEKLLAALEQARTPAERRDRVLFHVLLRVGLRVGSAVGLQVEDVDLDDAVLRLRRLKGGGEDGAFMSDETVELIRDHLAGRASGPLFVGAHGEALGTRQVHRRLAVWARRAGLTRAVSPHCLRHSFGTRVYRSTGDLLVTARAMCHRSLASTAVYARPSEAAVRAAVALTNRCGIPPG